MRLVGVLVIGLVTIVAAPTSAQTFGPPITGMCLLSRVGAIGASRAGQSMQAQLRQLQTSLSSELAQRRASLDVQRRAVEGRQAAIAPIEFQRQLAGFNQQARRWSNSRTRGSSPPRPAPSSRSTAPSTTRSAASSPAAPAAW